MPKTLWIELTSKCPYDCIFCTRKTRFGSGQHLDFEIYKSLLGELQFPEFIGLNYSGESMFYPHLIEAVRLANSTGASTELVTAFSTNSPDLLKAIISSGLHRLAISLHTMDSRQNLNCNSTRYTSFQPVNGYCISAFSVNMHSARYPGASTPTREIWASPRRRSKSYKWSGQ